MLISLNIRRTFSATGASDGVRVTPRGARHHQVGPDSEHHVSPAMEKSVLADRTQFPSDEIIASHLGRRYALWTSLFAYIHAEHPDFVEQWRFYNDGKQWLMKVTRKSKTVFWLSVIPGSFRITAYIAVRAQKMVLDSALSDEMKKEFRSGKAFGKIRGITITFRSRRDVEEAKALIGLKVSLLRAS